MSARGILLLASLSVGAAGCVAYAQPYPPPGPPDQGYPDQGYQQGYPDQGYQDPGYQDQGYQDPAYEDYQGEPGYDQGQAYDQGYQDEYNGQPVSVDYFYRQLSPYGRWIERPTYGWVWYPGHVPAGWRPYRYGRWVLTEYGWTWVSQEPFGWATYHYGRWTLDPEYGWVWVPGTEWGPAWVSWQEGSGYIGWAPLPPSVRFRVGFGLDLGGINLSVSLGPSWYSFVPERSFLAPSVATYVLPPARNVTIIRNTTNITRYTVVNNRIVNQSVPVQRIEQVTGQRIQRFRVADTANPAQGRVPRIQGDQITVFRPRVSTSGPVLPPPQAIAQRPARAPRNVQPGTRLPAPQPGVARRPAYVPQPGQPAPAPQPGAVDQPATRQGNNRQPRRLTPEEVQRRQQQEQQDLARHQAEEQRQIEEAQRQEQQRNRSNPAVDQQTQRQHQAEAQALREEQQREKQQLNARQQRERQNPRAQGQPQPPPQQQGVREGQQRQQQPARQNQDRNKGNKNKDKDKDKPREDDNNRPPR